MSTPNGDWIVTSKLYVPPARANLVPRPRLTQQIAASSSRLILISAPPGIGKTTLLSEWCAHARGPVAWLSLDEGDNDPVRFWSGVIAAFQTIHPNVGGHAQTLLRAQHSVDVPIESVLASLLNDLGRGTTTPTLTLALDDYHVIRNPCIDDALSFFVDHLPPSVRLILSSRTDPGLPLARLRAGSALTELREADLRFTPAEAGEFLNRVMGLHLSDAEIDLLETRTEGWIAGLQLAALSLSNRADAAAFIAAFTGSNRYVFDYLVEQVLLQQPEEVRSFLLSTCILDRLTGPLCDALTGGSAGSRQLQDLERANLFIVPLDDERRWYRYHHLFAEFLRHHVRQQRAGDMPARYQRAAGWCAANGLIGDAIGYALAAKDFELAAQLIAQDAWGTILRGEFVTLHHWLRALPDRLVRQSIPLSLALGWVLLVAGQLDAAEERLQDAERLLPPDDSSADAQFMRGAAAALRTFVTAYRGDFARTITLARAALAQLPPDHVALRSMLNLSLTNACWHRGELEAAEQAVSDALAFAGTPDGPPVDIIHYANQCMAEMQLTRGQLRQAAQTYRHALELAHRYGGDQAVTRGQTLVGLGNILREWNDLEGAIRHIDEGIALARQGHNAFVAMKGCFALARAQAACGNMEKATEALEEAGHIVDQWPSSEFKEQVEVSRVCLALASEQWYVVDRWQETRGAQLRSELAQASRDLQAVGPFREQEYIVLVRVLIAQGKRQSDKALLRSALELSERLTAAAKTGGRTGRAIELMALTALAQSAWADRAAARATLGQALVLAQPEGYIRLFVDEGEPMRLIIADLGLQIEKRAEAQHLVSYANSLLAAFSSVLSCNNIETKTNPQSPISNLQSPVSIPLTAREHEILRLIAQGKSNQEIANQLVLTLGTVKWYVNQILSKLDVHSRTEALARARELGLFL